MKFFKNKIWLIQLILNLVLLGLILGPNISLAVESFSDTSLLPRQVPDIRIPATPVSGAKPITGLDLYSAITGIAGFLIVVGPLILVAALIINAVTLMGGGASTAAVAKAKQGFWYSILGGLIVFGVGVIINTIAVIVSGQFFCRVGISAGPFGTYCLIR